MASKWIFLIISMMIAMLGSRSTTAKDVREVGICYGLLGDNLPPPTEVIALYKQYRVNKMRLYDPNRAVLEALRGQKIELVLGMLNLDVQIIASSQAAAESWFVANVQPYVNDVPIKFLVVGNEVVPGEIGNFVAPAMKNLLLVIQSRNLTIRVTTSLALTVLQNTYPPSASEFKPDSIGPIVDILKVLSGQPNSVLMVNVYPYFAYAGDPTHVSLEYAQFTAKQAVVHDGNLAYFNLFDAVIDGVYWALEKAGNFPGISLGVSETGWPSAGNGAFTTPELAMVYNKNFVQHISNHSGTPKRPLAPLEAYLFAMFNENQKPVGIEQNWGLFYPNKAPVYPLFPQL